MVTSTASRRLTTAAASSFSKFRISQHARATIERRHMRFVLVNGRTPRQRSLCVMCDQPIGAGYLRELGTRLPYCNQDCYADHCKIAVLLLENRSRASGAA
jgi:hypothetical protein